MASCCGGKIKTDNLFVIVALSLLLRVNHTNNTFQMQRRDSTYSCGDGTKHTNVHDSNFDVSEIPREGALRAFLDNSLNAPGVTSPTTYFNLVNDESPNQTSLFGAHLGVFSLGVCAFLLAFLCCWFFLCEQKT